MYMRSDAVFNETEIILTEKCDLLERIKLCKRLLPIQASSSNETPLSLGLEQSCVAIRLASKLCMKLENSLTNHNPTLTIGRRYLAQRRHLVPVTSLIYMQTEPVISGYMVRHVKSIEISMKYFFHKNYEFC